MPKLEIPKIIRPLDLRGYAPEMEVELQVWVNPPRERMVVMSGLGAAAGQARRELSSAQGLAEAEAAVAARQAAERLNQLGVEQMRWFAEIWSQGPDAETHWSLEEVRRLVEHAADTDPQLWAWMTARSLEMIREHRDGQKKG